MLLRIVRANSPMLQGALNKVTDETAIAQRIEKYKGKVRYDDMVRSVRHLRTAYNRESEHMEALSRNVRLLGCKADGSEELCFILFNMGTNFRDINYMLRGVKYGYWHGEIDRPSEVASIAILGEKSMIPLEIIKKQYDDLGLFFCGKDDSRPAPFLTQPETAAGIAFLFLNGKMEELKKELDKAEALLRDTEAQIEKIKRGE